MTTIFRFAVIGLGAGSLYALAALGLVLIFRGSKVVNFAQGVMGMMAAYVFYEVHQNWHVTDFLAIPAGLLTSAALGAAFFYLVIRRLRDASNLIKVVATLALLLVAQEAVLLIFGAAGRPVSSILPTNSVKIFGAPIGEDRLYIFGIVLVLTAVLWVVYKFTRVRAGHIRRRRESDCRRRAGDFAGRDRHRQLGHRGSTGRVGGDLPGSDHEPEQ